MFLQACITYTFLPPIDAENKPITYKLKD